MKKTFLPLSLICVAGISAFAAPLTIQLPPETAVYKSGVGADLANAQCLTCHSADYASMQPPMPAKFWKGEVEKMAAKYGAPIPTNEVDSLAEYFTHNYGTGGTTEPSTTAVAKETSVPANAGAKSLMQKSGCFNCHTVDKKIIGPAFKDIAAKYKGNPEGIAKVSHQIQNGGSGLWGPFPMPPFKQFSSAEVKSIADWVLSQQ
jgi:sulfite dehydrogenase